MNTMRYSPDGNFQGRTRKATRRGFLHGVVRLCVRAEHAVRHRRQAPAARFELLRKPVSIHLVTLSDPVTSFV